MAARGRGADDLFEDANTTQYSAAAREALLIPGEGMMYTLPTNSPLVRRDRVYDEPYSRTQFYGPTNNGAGNGNGNRIDIPLSCQGYLDPFTVRLTGDLQVVGDSVPPLFGQVGTVAYSKISLQAMIDTLEIFQMDSQFVERIVRYGYLQTFIGACLVTPWTALAAGNSEFEYGLTRPLGFAVTNNVANAKIAQSSSGVPIFSSSNVFPAVPLPGFYWNGEPVSANSANAPLNGGGTYTPLTWAFSLEIKCGLTQQKFYIPLQTLTRNLRFRFYLANYAQAFLDASFGQNTNFINSTSTTQDCQAVLLQPPRPWNPRVPAPTTSSGTTGGVINPYNDGTTGTYQLANLRIVYDRLTLSDAANAQVLALVNSSSGLPFHITSFLTSETIVLSGTVQTIDITEVCRSLKAVFPCFYAQNEFSDSYQMAMPWCPGFQGYQFKLGTNYYPEYQIQRPVDAHVAFQNAVGQENSAWYQPATTSWSLAPGSLVPMFMDPFQKAPAHNDFFQNQIILETATTTQNMGGPQGTLSGATPGLPTGWAYGVANSSSSGPSSGWSSGVLTVTTSAVTADSIVLLTPSLTGGQGGTYSATNLAGYGLYVSSITSGTSFTITSTNTAENRWVNWVVIPKPAFQLRTSFNVGAAPNTSNSAFNTDMVGIETFFFQAGADSSGATIAPNNVVGTIVGPYQGNAQALSGAISPTGAFYLLAGQQILTSRGAYFYQVSYRPGDFTALANGTGYVAGVPAPPGSLANAVAGIGYFPTTAAIIISPMATSNGVAQNLNPSAGDWYSRMAAVVNSDGTASVYLPNFALLSTDPTQTNQQVVFSVLVIDTSLFSASSLTAGTNAGGDLGWNNKFRNLNSWAAGTGGGTQFTARRGPWPLQWHPGDYATLVTGTTATTLIQGWSRGIFVPAWCFETDRHENTPSGLNLNIPAKRLQMLLYRNSPSTGNTMNWIFNTGVNVPVNTGGVPILEAKFFLYHDRFFRIVYGLIDSVEW